jgi:hypothetical protein
MKPKKKQLLGLSRESVRPLSESSLEVVHGGVPEGKSVKTGACHTTPPAAVWE